MAPKDETNQTFETFLNWPIIQTLPFISDILLAFALDKKGIIRSSRFFRQTDIKDDSLCGRSIHEFFLLPQDSSLSELSVTPGINEDINNPAFLFGPKHPFYVSKNQLESVEKLSSFLYAMPLSYLTLFQYDASTLFGIVRATEASLIGPHIQRQQHPSLLLSNDSRILGISSILVKRFGLITETARIQMLEKPVESFFDVSPFSAMIPSPADMIALFNDTACQKGCLPGELTDLPHDWNSQGGPQSGLIRLNASVNNASPDFRLDLDILVRQGPCPCILFNGAAESMGLFPDYPGYLIGPSVDGRKIVLKKQGVTLFETPFAFPFLGRIFHLTLIRQEHTIALFANHEPLLALHDPAPLRDADGALYLYTREFASISIRSCSLRFLPKKTGPLSWQPILRQIKGEKRTYRFQLVPEKFTRKPDRFFHWFTLYDITGFEERIESLINSEARALLERDRYRSLAKKHRKSEIMIQSESMKRIEKQALIAADSAVPILVEGETGTGKEVLARFIHSESPFAKGPFAAVDCSAIPENLLESELFGFEKGAFTGAIERRIGKFEAAHQGTLFLDEIGNLSREVQARLLRFLEDHALMRIGGRDVIRVETRIIGASNVPFIELVRANRLREDLYYRLNLLTLTLPPLRERREDIASLALHFLKSAADQYGRKDVSLSADAFRKLLEHDWPGNIRELKHAIERALLFSESRVVCAKDLQLTSCLSAAKADNMAALPKGARALRKSDVLAYLDRNQWIVKAAACAAGVSLPTFFRKMKKFEVRNSRA